MSDIERQRDAALIGYNECRATIEDARRVLGATEHEGLLLAAMRVTEQRDRLAEAMSRIANNRAQDTPQTNYAYEFGRMEGIAKIALAAWKEARGE
jgi:hypothetical protein